MYSLIFFGIIRRRFRLVARSHRFSAWAAARGGCATLQLRRHLTCSPNRVDLRSDTVSLPSQEMLQSTLKYDYGDDVYGECSVVNELQAKVANLLNKEDALFVPSGTMSNLIAIGIHTKRTEEIILGASSHIFYYEGGGAAGFMGSTFNTIENSKDGSIPIGEVEKRIRPVNDHYPRTSLVCLENTQNVCGGRVLSLEYLTKMGELCRRNGLPLHLDGARLWNAAAKLKVNVSELVKECDTVSVCLSKGLGSPAGSLLVGSKENITKARRIRKSLGGGMRQGVLAACGLYAVTNNIDRLQDDHRRCKTLALGLSAIPGITLDLGAVDTNIIYFDAKNAEVLKERCEREYNIILGAYGGSRLRVTTHLNISDEKIEKSLTAIRSIMSTM